MISKPSLSIQEMKIIKEQVLDSMGLDLSYFKTAFLERRINVRMKVLNITSGSEYAQLISNNSNEITSLYDSLSINVTRFYRDKKVWQSFSDIVIPKLLKSSITSDTIRIWSSGCASGEEAYSLAIMFSEAFKNKNIDFKILATDINKKALEKARIGQYDINNLKNLDPKLIKNYFQKTKNGNYQVNQNIINKVKFNLGDIVTFPANSLDVVFCRNVLIYYGKDAQNLIYKKFHNVLKDNSFLVLGMDETLWGNPLAKSFDPIQPRERIYQKKPTRK